MIGDSGGRGRILSKVPFCRILNDIRCLDGTVDGTVNGKMIVVIFTVLHSRVEFVVTVPFQIPAFQFLDRRSDGPRADMGGYEDDYGAPAPAPRAPRGGNMGGGQRQAPRRPAPQQRDDDLGPAFPSEASNMDEVPF